MTLEMKCYHKFSKIEHIWEDLQKQCTDNSLNPFTKANWMRYLSKHFWVYFLMLQARPKYFVFLDSGRPIAIIPCYSTRGKKLTLFADLNGFNYCDIICPDSSIIRECVLKIVDKYGMVKISKLRNNSALWQSVGDLAKNIKETICIKIEVNQEGYEAYFNSLSSHTRQNIRTAYNRLDREGRRFNLTIIKGNNHPDNNLWNEIINLYVSRHSSRYGVHTSRIKKWMLRHYHFATDNYMYNPDALTIALMIDGRLAAFMSGIIGDNELIVPRLSIDDTLSFYSPGMLLVNETIKYLYENTSIKWLDLSQGQEQYKYRMRGIEHITHTFDLFKQ